MKLALALVVASGVAAAAVSCGHGGMTSRPDGAGAGGSSEGGAGPGAGGAGTGGGAGAPDGGAGGVVGLPDRPIDRDTSYPDATELLYLSGKGIDDAVAWDFMVTGGRKANQASTIPVPSNWEFHGFGTFN